MFLVLKTCEEDVKHKIKCNDIYRHNDSTPAHFSNSKQNQKLKFKAIIPFTFASFAWPAEPHLMFIWLNAVEPQNCESFNFEASRLTRLYEISEKEHQTCLFWSFQWKPLWGDFAQFPQNFHINKVSTNQFPSVFDGFWSSQNLHEEAHRAWMKRDSNQ